MSWPDDFAMHALISFHLSPTCFLCSIPWPGDSAIWFLPQVCLAWYPGWMLFSTSPCLCPFHCFSISLSLSQIHTLSMVDFHGFGVYTGSIPLKRYGQMAVLDSLAIFVFQRSVLGDGCCSWPFWLHLFATLLSPICRLLFARVGWFCL